MIGVGSDQNVDDVGDFIRTVLFQEAAEAKVTGFPPEISRVFIFLVRRFVNGLSDIGP